MRKVCELSIVMGKITFTWYAKNDHCIVCHIVPASVFLRVHFTMYPYHFQTMSLNSKTKSKRTTHSEGCYITKRVVQILDREKSSGNLKFQVETAT